MPQSMDGATDSPTLEIFVSDSCPHCADAKNQLAEIAATYPQVQIVIRTLEQDNNAIAELQEYSRRAGVWPPGVPTFVIGDQILVGFGGSQGKARVEELIEHALQGDGPTAVGGHKQIEAETLGNLNLDTLGLPLFTIIMGLLDGFNPCAMWVLLFLLSMLIHLKDRSRMAWIAATFVVVSALVYYAFMAAWLNLFLAIGLSGLVRTGLAILALLMGLFNIKDFLAVGRGFSFSIPESAKPGVYARVRNILRARSLFLSLAGVAVLAVIVNFIEVLCTAGLPAMYTAVLTQQSLSALGYYAYLGLYILAYMADDALMVAIAVTALNSRKLSENTGRLLKLLSGFIMFGLGIVLLVKPELLV